MSTGWTEKIITQVHTANEQAIAMIKGWAEDAVNSGGGVEGADYGGLAVALEGVDLQPLVDDARKRAWGALPAAIGNMNRPLGKRRQQQFLQRAGITYVGLFAQAVGERAVELNDDNSVSIPSKGVCVALAHAATELLVSTQTSS